jgi:capsular polysaccharide biosynthesis protein
MFSVLVLLASCIAAAFRAVVEHVLQLFVFTGNICACMQCFYSSGTCNLVLLIMRHALRERAVVNEAELISAIQSQLRVDLELVVLHDPGEMEWEHTAQLAYRSLVLLGPHGGGLQNAVFMQPDIGAAVVEMNKPQRVENFRECFVTLSRGLNLRYWLIEHPQFDYNVQFNASIPDVMHVLRQLNVLRV